MPNSSSASVFVGLVITMQVAAERVTYMYATYSHHLGPATTRNAASGNPTYSAFAAAALREPCQGTYIILHYCTSLN